MKRIIALMLLCAAPGAAEDLRLGSGTGTLVFTQTPQSITFSNGIKPIVTIAPDGKIILGEGASLADEASRAFWDQVQRFNPRLSCPDK